MKSIMFFLSTKLYHRLKFQKACQVSFMHQKPAIILGIETSCDDTGCAIVDNTGHILAESLYSQHLTHLRFGGINPIFAKELHRDKIEDVVKTTINKANINMRDIDGIAVTVKPGLRVSLEVGVKYAKYIAHLHHKPLIPIHHMEAHALVLRLYNKITFPFLTLLISGGHCLLALVNDFNEFILLGDCLDNSPGEAFDKVARRMKLRNLNEYATLSGGQAIERAASKATNPSQFEFPLPLQRLRDCNFSFSGLKESLIQKLILKENEHNIVADGLIPEVNDLCAAFQMAVAKHLVHRTQRAIKFCKIKNLLPPGCNSLVVSGGVACNNFIFKSLEYACNKLDFKVFRPPPSVCVDNGVMIAWNGIEKFNRGCEIVTDINYSDIHPKAPLGRNIINEVKESSLAITCERLQY